MTGHKCKNHPSFRPTTLWDQTIAIDITLVIFTNISWLTSKDFFVFFVFFLVVETKMSQYWDWDYFFGAMDSSGSSGSAGSAAEEMVHGVFLGKRSQVQKNKGTMQFETWTWRWFWIFFLVIPIWGNDWISRSYFSNELKPPTRSRLVFFWDEVYEVLYRELGPTEEPLKNKAAVWATK